MTKQEARSLIRDLREAVRGLMELTAMQEEKMELLKTALENEREIRWLAAYQRSLD